MQPPGGRARHGERLLLPDDPASAQGQRIEECGGSIRGAKVLGIHDLERGRADPADRREGPGEVQGADPGIDASDARGQSTAAHRAVGAILGRLARLLRLLPDAHRAARTGLMDSSPITHVYLATVEERAASVRAIAPPGSVPLPRGRRGRGRVWVLAHGSPCDSTAGLVQRVLRLDRPSSIGGIANRLTRSNRRGTDPYARWCGRGGAARLPPIPINALCLSVRRVSFRSSPVQQVESLGQRDRVNRYTGGRKAAREEATGSSQKRREAGANQATAPRDPHGKVKATLLEAQS